MSTLQSLLDEFFAFWWREHPTWATAAGIHAYDGDLVRRDDAARAERVRHLRDYLREFERHTPDSGAEAIDRDLVVGRVRWELYDDERVRRHARDATIYIEDALGALYLMAVRDYAPAEQRARHAIERLRAWPAALDQARENLTEMGAGGGPGRVTGRAAPTANGGESGAAGREPLAGAAAASPVLARTAARLARSGLGLLRGVLPLSLGRALEDDAEEFGRWENALRAAEDELLGYARWLEDELAPRAAGDFAVGRDAWEAHARWLHGLTDDADAIEAYGERLRRQTSDALDRAAAEIEGGDGWRDVVERLKDEHPPADGLVDAYAAAMERARDFVAERGLVSIPADAALEVTPTPEFLRPLIPYAAYQPPAPHEPDQTGLFFVTPPEPEVAGEALRDHTIHGIPVTAVHEAYPGHHLQLVRANRADTEPRRVFRTSLFAEGWALYCEELMWDEGFYEDPRQRIFQLKDLLWRACRVVVDIGLHVRGWPPERAVDYLVERAGIERANAEIEVRRYCAEPTQPMSYALGKREILRLRDRYRARRGDAFDLREFHDRLLAWGTIPPALIARGMGLE